MIHRRLIAITVFLLVPFSLSCHRLSRETQLTWHLVLQVEPIAPGAEAPLSNTINILESRLNRIGIGYFTLREVGASGGGRIIVNLSATADRERVKRLLTLLGRLEIVHVITPRSGPLQNYSSEEEATRSTEQVGSGRRVLPYSPTDDAHDSGSKREAVGTRWIVVEVPSIINGTEIRSASPVLLNRSAGEYGVSFNLTGAGAEKLGAWTSKNIHETVALVLNNEVKTMLVLQSPLKDSGQIPGKYTLGYAEDLAASLNSAPLPSRVKIIEEADN